MNSTAVGADSGKGTAPPRVAQPSLTSRQRIATACNHREPDLLPVDFGGGFQTGIHVSMVYKLRQALGLDQPGTPTGSRRNQPRYYHLKPGIALPLPAGEGWGEGHFERA